MNPRNPAHFARGRQLLALEREAAGADEPADAAHRVLVKIHLQLDPLLGAAGVNGLLLRSAKRVERQFPFLADREIFASSTGLRDCLHKEKPEAAMGAAEAFFGSFSDLLSGFIGNRLTTELLRSAWPAIEDIASTESDS
jgi:hypothetical protein